MNSEFASYTTPNCAVIYALAEREDSLRGRTDELIDEMFENLDDQYAATALPPSSEKAKYLLLGAGLQHILLQELNCLDIDVENTHEEIAEHASDHDMHGHCRISV